MPVIEETREDGRVVRRYECDRCGSGCVEPAAPGPILCIGCQPPMGTEAFRESIVGLLRERLPGTDVDLRPGSTVRTLVDVAAQRLGAISRETQDQIIQSYISSAEGRSRLAQVMSHAPMRARRIAGLATRNTWVGIEWPGWAVEGAVVYYREEGYRAYRVTEVLPGSLKLSEVDPPDDNLALHFLYHDAENLDREWTPVVPLTAWERLLRDDP